LHEEVVGFDDLPAGGLLDTAMEVRLIFEATPAGDRRTARGKWDLIVQRTPSRGERVRMVLPASASRSDSGCHGGDASRWAA